MEKQAKKESVTLRLSSALLALLQLFHVACMQAQSFFAHVEKALGVHAKDFMLKT